MRKFIIIIIITLLTSCEVSSPITTAVTILADRTDSVIPSPELADLKPLLDIQQQPNNGFRLKLQNIGNVNYSPVYTENLKEGSLLDNTLQRGNDIKRFYKKMDTLIMQENNKKHQFHNSSILYPLIIQLKELENLKSEKKIVLLYSDLAEYSDVFNCYHLTNKQVSEMEIQSIAKRIKANIDIPDLNKIKLFIVYYPKTNAQNRLFQNMLMVYRELFKDSRIEIQVGLPN